ncbi:hypothetical protein NMR92_001287 [Vibrio cholerae]|uniref:Uncharacterized protein n=2 Tax=Vibrio TaxID=662 RepID=A0A1B1LRP5_VIBPH|nr:MULTISPECIES: hypothetical protein [Vibrio]ANS55699.1 hypothetical protein [Vibrio parahaemolyticus]EJL6460770.1 hypothetical protein [Vibrio cholerae]EJL6490387.1 hypothetical protein [Vibrio cholerae]EJL6642077.1 hypothetical protein [Vibrio cholerae]MBJ6954277.1 hypothetical protein [Vibrio cholerae]
MSTNNSCNSTDPKQTAAYLKRRSTRLRKKARFARDSSTCERLIHMADRAVTRANEIYFAAC